MSRAVALHFFKFVLRDPLRTNDFYFSRSIHSDLHIGNPMKISTSLPTINNSPDDG
jgi:hypothetical protein